MKHWALPRLGVSVGASALVVQFLFLRSHKSRPTRGNCCVTEVPRQRLFLERALRRLLHGHQSTLALPRSRRNGATGDVNILIFPSQAFCLHTVADEGKTRGHFLPTPSPIWNISTSKCKHSWRQQHPRISYLERCTCVIELESPYTNVPTIHPPQRAVYHKIVC